MATEEKLVKAGQYYLLEKIAQGGMAEIFKGLAYDLAGIKKTVCIKKILSHIAASQEFIDMLVDEAKIAVSLSQGNIAQVYDLGKAGSDYFIVMEYVEGQSLSKIQKKVLRHGERIPIAIACHIISEIAAGLNYMHRKTDEGGQHLNIVHRDISPQNIMVSYSGTVKIIDFGIAKAALKVGHTESGILKGKFAYMSPEHARGEKIDHRGDIFSMGVIFYELLTGTRLFKGADNKETLKNVRRAKAPPPSQIVSEIPKELDAIVLKAIAKNRKDRYAFASDLQEELLRFLHTHYPDFKSSQAADFVRNLFKEERELNQKLSQEEVKTPHLILEKTRSSAEKEEENTKGGPSTVDWREFLLETDWPEEKRTGEKRTMDDGLLTMDQQQEGKEEKEVTDGKGELTSRKWSMGVSFKWQITLISMAILLILGGTLLFLKVHRPWSIVHSPALNQNPATEEKVVLPALVEITSNPPAAMIYIDDQETGLSTPARLDNLALEAKHTLGLHLKRYKFYKTDFTLKAGETKNFFVELGLDYASLKITSTPAGAQIWLDGEQIGQTPFAKENLEPDKIIKIELRMEGYDAYVDELKTEPGKEHVVNGVLKRTTDNGPRTTDQLR